VGGAAVLEAAVREVAVPEATVTAAEVVIPEDPVPAPPVKLNGGAPLGEIASELTDSVADWVTELAVAMFEPAAVEDAVAVALEQVAATAESIAE